MKITININDRVRVRLTEAGRVVYRKFFTDLKCQAPIIPPDGVIEDPLWSIMNIFGPYSYMGCQMPFETEIERSRSLAMKRIG
jgi:hypothetical protein